MIQLTKQLPQILHSCIAYEAVQIENPMYDPIQKRYTARVYGVCRGVVMPLTLSTPAAVRKVEDVVITDEEIDAVLAEHPELEGDRTAAAISRAFARLYLLANEPREAANV